MKSEANEPAFPVTRDIELHMGLTKREWMATMCLERSASPTWSQTGPFNQKVYDNAALHAVKQADALLSALAQPQNEG